MAELTDQILQEIIHHKEHDKAAIPFIDKKDALAELKSDIDVSGFNLSKMAETCAIPSSQLSDFLNGKKHLRRDKILAILITLNYNLSKIQTTLRRLHLPMLYVRDQRDYYIAKGIEAEKSLAEIDEILFKEKLELLAQYARSGSGHTS